MLSETTTVKSDTPITKQKDKQTRLYQVVYGGITAITDVALWKESPYSSDSDCTFVFMNMYGSESQLRGIFSAIASHNVVTIKNDDSEIFLSRNWQSFLRYKSWKIGYGKYQALIWDETLLSECIVSANGKDMEAWETFLKKRRVPFLREWIPNIVSVLEKEELIKELHGVGRLRGWHWMASDNEVCDLIVKEIYTKAAE
jgi:hypothetical protein